MGVVHKQIKKPKDQNINTTKMGNIFNEIEEQSDVQTSNETVQTTENNSTEPTQTVSDEINFDTLSDVAIGQQKKYERESLDKKTVKIKAAKLFNADKSKDQVISAMNNPDVKYYKSTFIVTYDCQNKDGVDNREYMSGVTQFLQKDGSISSPNIWYEGSRSQAGALWEKVAKFKGVDPKELSPREFMNFLNSGPSAVIEYATIEYNKETYHKNIVKEFVK